MKSPSRINQDVRQLAGVCDGVFQPINPNMENLAKMREQRQGFMKVYHWVLDELEADYKALGLYMHLLKNFWHQRQPFEYKVNDRTYQVLAGQYMTSHRRVQKLIKMNRAVFNRCIAKLKKIHAIDFEHKFHVYKSGKKSCDGILFTALTPITFVRTLSDKTTHPYITNERKPIGENDSLSNNYLLNIMNNNKNHTTRARTRINNNSVWDEIKDCEQELARRDRSENDKNIPPDPLEDPNEYRFDLDQRWHQNVRQSVWRTLAVDWYLWASNNGRIRRFNWCDYPRYIREILDRGGVSEQDLRDMFDKVVKVDTNFWQKNFKNPKDWEDVFRKTNETRLESCMRALKALREKNKPNLKQACKYDDVHFPF